MKQLVLRARGGDGQAVAELYTRFWRAARTAAYAIVRDFSTAEDVAAEAFRDALAALTKLRLFLVDTGATGSMAPASRLTNAGILPVGRTAYELADGTVHEYQFGLAQIEFMGEVTAGRVIFGPEGVEPILGVRALESVGVTLDPATHTLKRLPAVPLKSCASR